MANDTPDKPPRRWLWPLLVFTALAVSAALGAAWKLLVPAQAPAPAAPIFVTLEPFTVNLQAGGPHRHLHVAVVVRVNDAASQALMQQYLPTVRSRVLATLSNREGASLLSPEARDALALEIEAALKRPLLSNHPGAHIAGVMFTTFLLQ